MHRNGQEIVDGNGGNVVLRGLGLGGWMVQEGYMFQTGSFAGYQHVIKQKITDLIGAKNNEKSYDAYKAKGITKKDIDLLALKRKTLIMMTLKKEVKTIREVSLQ